MENAYHKKMNHLKPMHKIFPTHTEGTPSREKEKIHYSPNLLKNQQPKNQHAENLVLLRETYLTFSFRKKKINSALSLVMCSFLSLFRYHIFYAFKNLKQTQNHQQNIFIFTSSQTAFFFNNQIHFFFILKMMSVVCLFISICLFCVYLFC